MNTSRYDLDEAVMAEQSKYDALATKLSSAEYYLAQSNVECGDLRAKLAAAEAALATSRKQAAVLAAALVTIQMKTHDTNTYNIANDALSHTLEGETK